MGNKLPGNLWAHKLWCVDILNHSTCGRSCRGDIRGFLRIWFRNLGPIRAKNPLAARSVKNHPGIDKSLGLGDQYSTAH